MDEQSQRRVLFKLGKELGWPRLPFLPHLTIGAGEYYWPLADSRITLEQLPAAVATARQTCASQRAEEQQKNVLKGTHDDSSTT